MEIRDRVEFEQGRVPFRFKQQGVIIRRSPKPGFVFVKLTDGGQIKRIALSELKLLGQETLFK